MLNILQLVIGYIFITIHCKTFFQMAWLSSWGFSKASPIHGGPIMWMLTITDRLYPPETNVGQNEIIIL